MSCSSASGVAPGIPLDCPPVVIGCVPVTVGEPTIVPEIDQLPFHFDPTTGCLWFYVCSGVGWASLCPNSLCDLDAVDISGVNDLCNALNIPVTYDVQGNCVEGTITLQNLADEIADCIGLNDCCYEPFIDEGTAAFTRSRCFVIDNSANQNTRLLDSLTSEFHTQDPGETNLPMAWSYTNVTNQPGILKVSANMWGTRFTPTVVTPAHILFMVGRETDVYGYPLDPSINGNTTNTPHNNEEVSYDIRRFEHELIYAFWGNWLFSQCPACDPGFEQAADVNHEFLLQPGETIDLAARIAIGYKNVIDTDGGDSESGWVGATVKYVFTGSNQL